MKVLEKLRFSYMKFNNNTISKEILTEKQEESKILLYVI